MPEIIRKRTHYVGNIYDTQPVGEIIQCERETPPAGYIELTSERQSVLRSKYPQLFAQIGTTYGAEDDEHFNLPKESEVGNVSKNYIKSNYGYTSLPNGIYSSGSTVSCSITVNTTRGNPLFIAYSGDFNSPYEGSAAPWVYFKLYVDNELVRTTVVDYSSAISSDNACFAGDAIKPISIGTHTIRLDAVISAGQSGTIQFQEQDNIQNLVAFEL